LPSILSQPPLVSSPDNVSQPANRALHIFSFTLSVLGGDSAIGGPQFFRVNRRDHLIDCPETPDQILDVKGVNGLQGRVEDEEERKGDDTEEDEEEKNLFSLS
jgi:hypothetical protein